MKNRIPASRWLAAAGVAVAFGCSSSVGPSGETHFLACRTTSDCRPDETCIADECRPTPKGSGGSGGSGVGASGGAGGDAGEQNGGGRSPGGSSSAAGGVTSRGGAATGSAGADGGACFDALSGATPQDPPPADCPCIAPTDNPNGLSCGHVGESCAYQTTIHCWIVSCSCELGPGGDPVWGCVELLC